MMRRWVNDMHIFYFSCVPVEVILGSLAVLPPPRLRSRDGVRPFLSDSPGQREDEGGVFHFAYGIAHDGGGVLKCQWAPEVSCRIVENDASFSSEEAGSGASASAGEEDGGALGLLGAVFTDGSLR